MTIGNKIRALRAGKQYKLREQAEIFGVSLNSAYRWEHDLSQPKSTTLRRIAKHYEVPYEWFFAEEQLTGTAMTPEEQLEHHLVEAAKIIAHKLCASIDNGVEFEVSEEVVAETEIA